MKTIDGTQESVSISTELVLSKWATLIAASQKPQLGAWQMQRRATGMIKGTMVQEEAGYVREAGKTWLLIAAAM